MQPDSKVADYWKRKNIMLPSLKVNILAYLFAHNLILPMIIGGGEVGVSLPIIFAISEIQVKICCFSTQALAEKAPVCSSSLYSSPPPYPSFSYISPFIAACYLWEKFDMRPRAKLVDC